MEFTDSRLFQIISFKKYFYVSLGNNFFNCFCGGPLQRRMLSMFGRTGAPQKDNFFHFLQHGNKPEMLK